MVGRQAVEARPRRRSTRSSPTRRVTPSASRRSSSELGGLAADSEQVAKSGQGDRACRSRTPRRRSASRVVVGGRADRRAVAQPDQAALALEEAGELPVAWLRRVEAGGGELALEGLGLGGACAEDGARSRCDTLPRRAARAARVAEMPMPTVASAEARRPVCRGRAERRPLGPREQPLRVRVRLRATPASCTSRRPGSPPPGPGRARWERGGRAGRDRLAATARARRQAQHGRSPPARPARGW